MSAEEEKKGTGPICRDQPSVGARPEGAAHKLDLSPFSPTERMVQLFSAQADEWSGLEEREELLELLRRDPQARAVYIEQAILHSLLFQKGRRGEGLAPSLLEIVSGGEKGDRSNLCAAPFGPFRQIGPVPFFSPLGFLGGTCQGAAGYLSQHPMVLSYLVATVFFAVATGISSLIYVSHDYRVAGNMPSTASQTSPPEMEVVGRITGTLDCRWVDPQAIPVGRDVALGQAYALSSGLMEITYQTGAKVILEGPCTYEIESPNGGYLSLGKLTARVESGKPQAANPQSPIPNPQFVVKTPTAVVTDLGTEFGVEVTREGRTDAKVFRGAIRVATAVREGDTGSEQVCREGEAVRVEAGKSGKSVVRTISPEERHAGRFVCVMPSKKAIESQAYAELVLSLKPTVYYRMELPKDERDRDLVFDSAPGGHHGELRLGDRFGGSPYRPGRFGDAIWLRGPGAGDRVIVPDYPKTTSDRLTVSAWVMATGRPGWAMIASNWGGQSGEGRNQTGQFHFGLYRLDGDLCTRMTQRDGQLVQVREGTSHLFPLFVWQHVAFVADGTNLHLYRNGKEVASSPSVGILRQPPTAGLGVGCKLTNETGTDAALDTPGCSFWRGWIDELAIFNQALSAEQIGQLYLGKPNVAGTRRVPPAASSPSLVPGQLPLGSDIHDTDGTRSVPTTSKGDQPMNGP